MRLTVTEALNILNSANLEGGGYTADAVKYGIKSGKMPIGFAVPGEKTDYYPDGKTTYVIESYRLMKWIKGADISDGTTKFIQLHNMLNETFYVAIDKIVSIRDGFIYLGTNTDDYEPVTETAEEIMNLIKAEEQK